jgi:hypothetical protein
MINDYFIRFKYVKNNIKFIKAHSFKLFRVIIIYLHFIKKRYIKLMTFIKTLNLF